MLITPKVFLKVEILCRAVNQPVNYVSLGARMRCFGVWLTVAYNN